MTKLFSGEKFGQSQQYLEQLGAIGVNFFKDFPVSAGTSDGAYFFETPLGQALDSAFASGMMGQSDQWTPQTDALRWLLDRAHGNDLTAYPLLAVTLVKRMLLPCSTHNSSGNSLMRFELDLRTLSTLRKAGLPVDSDDYVAFRNVYREWFKASWRQQKHGNGDGGLVDGYSYPAGQYGGSPTWGLVISTDWIGPLGKLTEVVAPTDRKVQTALRIRTADEFAQPRLKDIDTTIHEYETALQRAASDAQWIQVDPNDLAAMRVDIARRRLGTLCEAKSALNRLVLAAALE